MSEKKRLSALWLFDFAADFAAITAAYYSVLFFRIHTDFGERVFAKINLLLRFRAAGSLPDYFSDFYVIGAPRIILLMMAVLCFIYAVLDLYPSRRFIFKRPLAARIVAANALALLLFYTYFYLSRNIHHPRSFFGPVILINIFLGVFFRSAVSRLLAFLRSKFDMDIVPTVLAGSGREADLIAEYLDAEMPHGVKLVKRIGNKNANLEEYIAAIEHAIHECNCGLLILADTNLSVAEIMGILERTDALETDVKVLSKDMAILPDRSRIWTDRIGGIPLVHFSRFNKRRVTAKGGWFSRIAAALLLLPLFPFIALLALIVKISSRGPILFVQERIGVNRKPFLMFKFRTMYQHSDEMQAQLEEFNESGAALFKIKKDPRITPVGKFLRRFSLDEVPQLLNVVRGEMVFVGPRPLPKRDLNGYYEKWHYSRHSGMPGLTCLWQVSGRSDLNFQNMCVLDVYYLRNKNWVLDAVILFRTIWVVLFARGAY